MSKEEELMARLQKLWAIATNTCGSATAQVVAEIREIEARLEELKKN